MKILSFEKGGSARVGAHVAEGVIDLTACLRTTHPSIQTAQSVLSIIQSGLDIDRFAEESISELRGSGRLARFVVEKPTYLPPVTNPPKILALALNFQEHIDETNLKFYQEPIVFTKYPSNMIGHEGEIELPPFPQKVDEEHELGLVVGRDCRHIRPSQAADYVFGWTICNDVSARNRQRERGQMGQPYAYAKNLATFAPIGPWIVTKKTWRMVPDIETDMKLYDAMVSGNYDFWKKMTLEQVEDCGGHETLNWFALMGAMQELGQKVVWSDILPTYIFNATKVTAIFGAR